MKRNCQKRLLITALIAIAPVFAILLSWVIITRKESSILTIEDSPEMAVGLVLGCSPALRDGRLNLFFQNRIVCAAALYHRGKVSYLLVSGDHSRLDYDEPTAMRDALIRRGVPSDRIILDYAGFSTLDSVVRAKEVFGQHEFIIVSQKDHAMRAIFLAEAHGIPAVGVAADEVRLRYAYRTKAREALARVRAVLDVCVLGRKPRFLGPPIEIPRSQTNHPEPADHSKGRPI